jgi:hypothetical protein
MSSYVFRTELPVCPAHHLLPGRSATWQVRGRSFGKFAHVTVAHLSFQEATQSSYVEDLRYIGGGQIFGILLLVTFLKLVSKFMVK